MPSPPRPRANPEEAVDYLKESLTALDDALTDTKALDPPAELQDAYDDYVASFEAERDIFGEAEDAAEAGDRAGMLKAMQAFVKNDSQDVRFEARRRRLPHLAEDHS